MSRPAWPETFAAKTFVLLALCQIFFLRPAPAAVLLTNAADVLALSPQQASNSIPISVTGVVTAMQTNWYGRFFLQDSSGGVFVDCKNNQPPQPGDLLHVTGVSHPGGYAPVVHNPHWTKLGMLPQPAAKPVTLERLMSGAEDSQRVEISGIVRVAEITGGDVSIDLVYAGYRLRAYVHQAPEINPSSLMGARVLMRGTAAAVFDDAKLRRIMTVNLYVPQPQDLVILDPAPPNPFAAPLIPLNGVAQFRKDRLPGDLVHVKGMVTYQRKGEDLFLEDGTTGGLQVKSKQDERVFPGEEVEAVGFPASENFMPVLEDAEFRTTGATRVTPVPQPATVDQLTKGLFHAELISLKGRLINRLVPDVDPKTEGSPPRTILLLQSSNQIFTAEADSGAQNNVLASIPIGSLLQISGICMLEGTTDEVNRKVKSFRLLLPPILDINILESPGWLTPQHLLASLLVVFLVLLIAIFWTVMVSKNNLILKSLVREKESAQHALQHAHDELEERVQERTNQLKIEMTARKESELEFRATLTERTRLAQELHDTLEQTMTGIALQMDMVASLFAKSPEDAALHLKLARNLMRQSQVDVRQSVWGLRSRATEQFNLTNAVLINGRQIAGGAGIKIEVETVGDPRPLPEVIEENLMRMSQEAITNVVKHSGANTVIIELHFHPEKVILQIKDNGRGFNPQNCAGPQEGHFGLLGISERTERLGGRVQITSTDGAGTLIRVEIPLPPLAAPLAHKPAESNHEERNENTNLSRG